MAKGYYETEGSDYLNNNPSVSKEGAPFVPNHTHDDRYFTKEETALSQRDYEEQFNIVDDRITATQNALNDKASSNHSHGNATSSLDGFMSSEDKSALARLVEGRTNIHLRSTTAQTLAADTSNKLLFNTTVRDTLTEYTKATDTITVKKTGMYFVSGSLEVTNTATSNGRIILQVFKEGVNDTDIGFNYILTNTYGGVTGSTCMYLQEGEKLTFHAWVSFQIATRGKEQFKITRIW